MGIVSSTYVVDDYAQSDGRHYVTETHTDSEGGTHTAYYLAPSDWTATEYQATLDARAVIIADALAQQEIDEELSGG